MSDFGNDGIELVPQDEGAVEHLLGMEVPRIALQATDGTAVDLCGPGISVVYAYPRTSPPGGKALDGWDAIPGARGCTPQSCAFRDHFAELKALGASHLFGLSTQTTEYQREAAERLHLPFPLLSDHSLRLASALGLPMFKASGLTLLRRLTMIIQAGVIRHVFYPVHPPEKNAEAVISWLKINSVVDAAP
ncbi:peroxiredoxin [Agrobacterium tumefaciens]|uniref:Peroxiredoxin n=1 Tax=Agrobacterium tumefaciens TaxID=358 RepID=A0A176X3K5_AGRTU|nr:peroxiredoxin [Agrobacterium tumefaciens]OAE41728.1 peroxiredoxin [Agrobacterium tumefaciens]